MSMAYNILVAQKIGVIAAIIVNDMLWNKCGRHNDPMHSLGMTEVEYDLAYPIACAYIEGLESRTDDAK